MIPIAIVDDKAPIRGRLSEYMETRGFQVVCLAENGAVFLEYLENNSTNKHPQVVLMDIDMPVKDGIETVSDLSTLYPGIKCIMLSVFDDDDKIFQAIKAGALGYYLKDEKPDVIQNGIIELIELGGSPMSPSIARKALSLLVNRASDIEEASPSNLSNREMEILQLLVEGEDYKEIAERMFISPHTVRKHISNIYEKLHVNSKVQAVKMAIKKKWF